MLTHETAARLIRHLQEHFGRLSVRRLKTSLHFRQHELDSALAAGLIRLEQVKPRTGRPSVVACIVASAVEKLRASSLPYRAELPVPISFADERFLREYIRKGGVRSQGMFPRGFGSGSQAYRMGYFHASKRRAVGSARVGASRMMRRPWIQAGKIIARYFINRRQAPRYPADLRSRVHDWLPMLRALTGRDSWPAPILAVIVASGTFDDLVTAIRAEPEEVVKTW